jgi:hypothetical protein
VDTVQEVPELLGMLGYAPDRVAQGATADHKGRIKPPLINQAEELLRPMGAGLNPSLDFH